MPASIKNTKAAAPTGPMVHHGGTNDLEAFQLAIRAWHLDFTQTEPGPFRSRYSQLDLDAIRYDRAEIRAPLIQRGDPPADRWIVALPAALDPHMTWRGRPLASGMVPIYHPGSEINAISRDGFHVLPVAFKPCAVARLARDFDLPGVERALGATDVIRLSPDAHERVTSAVWSVHTTIAENPAAIDNPAFQELATTRVPAIVLEAIAGATEATRPDRPGATFARCLEIIDAAQLGALTVTMLASRAGVTMRAIEYAFQSHAGVGPKRYLRALQLAEARRRLRARTPGERITDIAGACGFWHMGQFAAEYRRMFDELPSQTTARK